MIILFIWIVDLRCFSSHWCSHQFDQWGMCRCAAAVCRFFIYGLYNIARPLFRLCYILVLNVMLLVFRISLNYTYSLISLKQLLVLYFFISPIHFYLPTSIKFKYVFLAANIHFSFISKRILRIYAPKAIRYCLL